MRGRRPREREPVGQAPERSPARRYVRLFVLRDPRGGVDREAERVVARRGERGVLPVERRCGDVARASALATIEDVVTHAHPAADRRRAVDAHVHPPGGGHLCARVAPRSKSEASRPAVWASGRERGRGGVPDGRRRKRKRGDEEGAWSACHALLARALRVRAHDAPGPRAVLRGRHASSALPRRGRGGRVPARRRASRDGGETWSGVSSLRLKTRGETTSSETPDACAWAGGTLPARPGPERRPGRARSRASARSMRRSHATHGVSVLVSADAGDGFTRAASVACCGRERRGERRLCESLAPRRTAAAVGDARAPPRWRA